MEYTKQCTREKETFHIVLQCRIKPEALKITTVSDYWLINEPKNIRPYGIILFTAEQYDQIEQLMGSSEFYEEGCEF